MVQFCVILSDYQRVETDEVCTVFSDKDLIGFNVFRSDGEGVFPVLDPVVRVTPVALRVVRQTR